VLPAWPDDLCLLAMQRNQQTHKEPARKKLDLTISRIRSMIIADGERALANRPSGAPT
jgi:hypothetical protein